MKFFASIFSAKLKNAQEPWLEPLFRQLRFLVAQRDLQHLVHHHSNILDFGCGPEAQFLQYLKSEQMNFGTYVGVDPLLVRKTSHPRVTFRKNLSQTVTGAFNLVTMFAVLEHLPYPNFPFGEIADRLKPGGFLILTTPSPAAKPILEFLSYRLGIVSRREIEEHTHYFSLPEIAATFAKFGMVPVRLQTFEFGLNNYAVLQKRYTMNATKRKG